MGAQSAYAVCTNPDGNAGVIKFNKDFQVMQYCDDTNWRQLGSSPNGPQNCPNIGDTCTDGTIYAGLSPDGNVAIYTTPADAPSTYVWNNGNSVFRVDTTMVDCTDNSPGTASSCQTGEANTAILIAEDSDSAVGGVQPHQAAEYCEGLSAHGHSDWYLPAQDELNVLYTNKNAGDLNGTFNESGSAPAGWYWSSSERGSSGARAQIFSGGSQNNRDKFNGSSVRCVRKEGRKIASIVPDGLVGHWKLDETSGTGIIDYASTNDGTVQGGLDPATDSVLGRVKTALDFDGSDDSIDFPDDIFDSLSEGSVSAWFKWDGANPNDFQAIVGVDQDAFQPISIENYDLNMFGNCVARFTTDGDYIQPNIWYHVVYVSDATGNKIYLNGNQIPPSELTYTLGNSTSQLFFSQCDDVGSTLAIGDYAGGFSEPFSGIIDDVRIYNRALSAEEITYLYRSFDGNLAYDADTRVPKYFNGEDWVAMGPSKYIPNAVTFDGSTNLLNTSAAGYSDSDAFNLGFWVKPTTEAADFQVILNADTGAASRFTIALDNGANNTNDLWTVYFESRNSSGALVAEYESAELLPANQWSHVLISVDASESVVQSYIDDSLDTYYIAVNPGNGNINFNVSEYAVGEFAGTGDSLIASLADFYFDTGSYTNLSIETNRRKFIDDNGDPVYLGSDGGNPTGSAPDIFLSGDTVSWHTNKGTGGGFTENGALTDAVTKPGSVYDDITTDGLIGWWKLDEIVGNVGYDYSSSGNNGTYDSDVTPSYMGQPGVMGSAVNFNVPTNNADITVPRIDAYANLRTFTAMGWAKTHNFSEHNGIISIYGIFDLRNAFNAVNTIELETKGWDGSNAAFRCTLNADIPPYEWAHWAVAYSYDDPQTTMADIYFNGQPCPNAVYTATGNPTGSYTTPLPVSGSNGILLVGRATQSSGATFKGVLDDVRLYDRKLLSGEVLDIYNAGVCANPERLNGTIVYNTDQNLLQYCDSALPGNGWQATSP
ncbi:MAG: LamG-like jellyroll fold domain-containing protein [Roseovarius sp.]